MGAEFSSEAVVLRRSNTGEADRRLTLLTRSHGKIDAIAKGARKGGSRLAGSSEPLVHAVFTFAEGRARRFVTQVQPVTSFPDIRSDYDKMMAATALAELIAVSVPYESPQFEDDSVFVLFLSALTELGKAQDWKAALVWAESKLMDAEGIHPEWTTCAVSGRPLSDNPAFVSPAAGGYVEASLAGQFDDRILVKAETLIALKKVALLEAAPMRIAGADECLKVLFTFWRHGLENRLPANEAVIQGLPAT